MAYQIDSYQDGLDFNGAGIIALGLGILLQAFVSTCAINKSAFAATWCSDPLTNAKACHGYHVSTSAFTSLQCSNISRGTCSESISAGPVSGMTIGRAPELHVPNIMAPSSTHSQIPSKCTCRHITYSFSRERQPSMRSILPNACLIQYIPWAFFGAFAIWSGTLVAIDYKIDDLKNLDNTSDEWKHFGYQYFLYADNSRLLQQDFISLLGYRMY